MARIKDKKKIPIKDVPNVEDYLVGSDSEDGGKTSNFKIGAIRGGSSMSDAAVKVAYENNPDTNEFSDAEKSKLSGAIVGTTSNGKLAVGTLNSGEILPASTLFINGDDGNLFISEGGIQDLHFSEDGLQWQNAGLGAKLISDSTTNYEVLLPASAGRLALIDDLPTGGLVASDIDTLAELNAIVTDATLIDVGDLPTSTVDFDPVGTDNSDNNAVNTLYSGLATSKQDTLVSTTNIKTINGTTILGSGDLVVDGGATGSDVAYDVITWDANTDVPTKNVISDLYENKTFKVDTDGALVPIVPIYWQGTQAEFTTKFGATAPDNYFTVVTDANPPAIEGTDIASTGEVGGTKYLREDGDGTSSWQPIVGGGDMLLGTAQTVTATKTFDTSTSSANIISNNTLDGSGIFATNSGTGRGVYINNTGVGEGISSLNYSTGIGILSNSTTASTGFLYAGQNEGVNSFTVNKTGDVIANSFNGATITSGTLNGSVTGTNTGDQVIPVTGVDFDPVGTDNSDDNAVNTLYSGLVSATTANVKAINDRVLEPTIAAGAYAVDYSLAETWFLAITEATALTELNLPSAGESKVITIHVSGNFALTYPAGWDTNITGAYAAGAGLTTITVEYVATAVPFYKVLIVQ